MSAIEVPASATQPQGGLFEGVETLKDERVGIES